MKKNLLLFILACFCTIQSKSQYTSQWIGFPTNYEVGAGFATRHTPGAIWVGYLSTVQNIQSFWHINKNFCISGSGQSAIYTAYQVFESNSCTGSLSQVLTGNGIDAIETTGPNNLRYAIAGTYDKACYFVAIDKFGNVLSKMSYPFPTALSSNYAPPSKPIIIEEGTSNSYFICGTFENEMYVINVKANGTIIWSSFYSLLKAVSPKDMIVNPYNPHELIVVGEARASATDKQAFFMSLDASNGVVFQTKTYGNLGTGDGFETIIPAADTGGDKDAFIVGGYSQGGATLAQFNATGKTAWACKLDGTGNMIWSYAYTPSMGYNGSIIDIIERLNTSNNYEYYALLEANAGMQVLKLNDQGQAFPTSAPNALHNEFLYDLPATIPSRPTSISLVNNGAPGNPGLHMFGTATNYAGYTSSYYVSAYFNGERPCYRTLGNMLQVRKGSYVVNAETAVAYGSLTDCSNFQVTAFFTGAAINQPCNGTTIAGNNQRGMPTSINEEEMKNPDFSVFPNPVKDRAVVNYSSADNSVVSIQLYNVLSQHIQTITPNHAFAGTYQEEIDFTSLQLENGIYIVNTIVDGVIHKQKIVYSK